MKKSDWQKQYGARRRAIDRALLAELERALIESDDGKFVAGVEKALKIPREPRGRVLPFPGSQTPSELEISPDDARIAIAKAFGRPLH